ncbi:hypothetical protein BGX30_012517 [Mortierella sp. GBA39]|nr:hypothetical protein BGX30_012517 [Mortierella sp. GBA39]
MIRTFPLVAVFAMLATFCLSTTSAIPVAKRDATSTAECVHRNWDQVRVLLSTLSETDQKKLPELFKEGEPITVPSVDDIKTGLDNFEKHDSNGFLVFLQIVRCDNV